MRLSYILLSYNRRETLLSTLARLHTLASAAAYEWELFVVDNDSSDGSADAAEQSAPWAQVIRNPVNEGMSARNHAIEQARGEYIVFLDDDSYPLDDTVDRSMAYLDATPQCAAVLGDVILPSGHHEAPAIPTVLLGGASCVRRSVFGEVGMFPTEFFRQAEEYDLAMRIWDAGYTIDRFEDLRYGHEKVPGGRAPAVVHRLDMRNNLIVAGRYFPDPLRDAYATDWAWRYGAMAKAAGHAAASRLGRIQAWAWACETGDSATVSESTMDRVFGLSHVRNSIARWRDSDGIRRVALADASKNLYAAWKACEDLKLEVAGLIDPNPAFFDLRYRGVPVVPSAAALEIDGIVLTNQNPAQIDARYEQLQDARVPVLRLWRGQTLGTMSRAA